MRLFFVLYFSLFHSFTLSLSQTWESCFSQLAEEINEDESNLTDLGQMYDVLSELAENPLNLNAITEDQLLQMQFLNEWQIKGILQYVDRYAPVRTYAELMMIPYLDPLRRNLLSCLTYLGEAPLRSLDTNLDSLRYKDAVNRNTQWRNESVRGGDIVATLQTDFSNGIPKNWLRTNYRVNPNVKFGFVASQDAGEKYRSTGFDYYSGYVQLKNYFRLARGKGINTEAVIGRYRLRTGTGLVINNNSSLFHSSLFHSSLFTSLSPHTSRSEANYLQGAAVRLTVNRRLTAVVFGSYRSLDATLNSDGSVKTILSTGYHRTDSEIEKRHNTMQSAVGGNLCYEIAGFHVGINAVFAHYNRPLQPYLAGSSDAQLYRKYYPSGYDFWNLSLEYGYKLGKRLSIDGETATGNCNTIATINRLSWRTTGKLTLQAIQRYYPYQFYSIMGNSYSSGSRDQNESGIYLRGQWTPSSRFSLTAYTDFAYHAWYRYQKPAGGRSYDNLLQLSYLPTSESSLNLRYRWRNDRHALRSSYSYKWGDVSARIQFDGTCYQPSSSLGAMLSANVSYKTKSLSCSTGLGYYNTKDYNSRLYIYEASTPYTMSSQCFYGSGAHAYALAQLNGGILTKALKRLSLISKYSFTSGAKHDLTLALRYKL